MHIGGNQNTATTLSLLSHIIICTQHEVLISFALVSKNYPKMLENMIESMGMLGYGERNPAIDTPTAAATSAAYARALEGATAATKSSIAKYYPRPKEFRHSSILNDTRDQPIKISDQEEIRDTIHTIPLSKIEEKDEEIYSRDIEAKNLLQSILHLDPEVTEAAAAVYHYFETKTVDDEVSPGARAVEVIHSIKEQLRRGNSKTAYQFLETAKSVLPILLEEREEVGLQLEAKIFSQDSEDSAPSGFRTPVVHVPIDLCSQHDDMRSISEQTAAIFQYLDDARSFGTAERTHQSEDPAGTKIFNSRDTDSNIFRIMEEQEDAPEFTPDEPIDFEDPSQFNAPNVDDMDLEFVENFDLAYSEFLFYHPKLVAKNPELLKNLRIYKLEKFLEYNEVLERINSGKLHEMFEQKRVIEESMQAQLKDAVSKKAARQTLLQSEVNDIYWNTKQIQGKLRWKLFRYSEDRAKRQSKLREQFKEIPQGKTRQDLIRLIPEGPHSKKLETAIKASFIAEGSPQPNALSPKKEDQLRKIQVENAVLNSEMLMVNQKIDRLRKEAKKLEWVQSTLVELNPVAVHKFKKKFEGVKV